MLHFYLAYALSFIIFGFAIGLQSFSSFRVLSRRSLMLLSGFALTHGIYEFQDFFQVLEMHGVPNTSPTSLDHTLIFLLPISFMLLFAFSIELLIESKYLSQRMLGIYLAAPIPVALMVLFPDWSHFSALDEWPLRLEIACRLMLAFPGSWICALALARFATLLKPTQPRRFIFAIYGASACFLVYGVVAGLLVLNSKGFPGFPEHGLAAGPWTLGLRLTFSLSITILLSYAFFIELASAETAMRKMRDEFSSVLAHDIGNITGAIKMSSDIVTRERAMAHLEEPTKRLLRIIDSNTKLLQNLIAELFDLSLMELKRFRLDCAVHDLRPVISQICEQMTPTLDGRSLIIRLPERELNTNFDRQRVGRVLINLLSNAVKYSHAGSEITVAAVLSDSSIAVTVTSTGQPIPKLEAERLFIRYYRSKNQDNKKGAGLGLFIVKEIIEAHGGSVSVDAEPSGKTTFGFSLATATAPSNVLGLKTSRLHR